MSVRNYDYSMRSTPEEHSSLISIRFFQQHKRSLGISWRMERHPSSIICFWPNSWQDQKWI